MENRKKEGEGEYTIIKRFVDNTEKKTMIKGIWRQDILKEGKLYH